MKRKTENNEEENEHNKRQKIDDSCPICLDTIKDKNYVITKCNHKFCFSCLSTCCNINNKCPLCREEIKEFKQKNLPVFKNENLLNNMLDSFGNPLYNLFNHIDIVRNNILDSILIYDDIFTNEESEFKSTIIEKLENSVSFKNYIDTKLIDHVQYLINNTITLNSLNMVQWYKNNF